MSAELKYCEICEKETTADDVRGHVCSECLNEYGDYHKYCPHCGGTTVFDSWDDSCKECFN